MIEELLVERDWAVGLVGLDLLDQSLYPLLYEHLDERALFAGRRRPTACSPSISTTGSPGTASGSTPCTRRGPATPATARRTARRSATSSAAGTRAPPPSPTTPSGSPRRRARPPPSPRSSSRRPSRRPAGASSELAASLTKVGRFPYRPLTRERRRERRTQDPDRWASTCRTPKSRGRSSTRSRRTTPTSRDPDARSGADQVAARAGDPPGDRGAAHGPGVGDPRVPGPHRVLHRQHRRVGRRRDRHQVGAAPWGCPVERRGATAPSSPLHPERPRPEPFPTRGEIRGQSCRCGSGTDVTATSTGRRPTSSRRTSTPTPATRESRSTTGTSGRTRSG